MNKYFGSLKGFKTGNYLFSLSSFKYTAKQDNSQSFNSRQYEKYFKSMTSELTQEKEKDIRTLYDNLEAENYSLTKKIKSILETDSAEELKTITIINEVNKLNIKNTEHLLDIHQRYIFNFNYNFIEFILISYEKILRIFSPRTVFTLIALYFGYLYFKKHYIIGKKVEASDLIKYYRDHSDKVFKFNGNLPIFYDHKNLTNLIVNGKYFFLIGPKGIGKTYSIKHFCLLEAQKESIVIYKDLSSVDRIDNIYEFICGKLISFYKRENNRNVNLKTEEILEELKGRKVFFVMDHFLSNPKNLNSIRKVIDVLKAYNFNIILVSDSNKNTEIAFEGKASII